MRTLLLLLLLPLVSACDMLLPLRGDFGAPATPTEAARVDLGRRLFHEPALSLNGALSCASCHPLERWGQDGQARSRGVTGMPLRRNTPSVLNAAGQLAQFWDGRRATVEEQALDPLFSRDEMGLEDDAMLVDRLERSGYRADFERVFSSEPEPLGRRTVGLALGAFERTLATRAPIDDFLEGRLDALDGPQRRGFDVFTRVGCTNCHAGRLVGGERFERLGDARPWPDESDLGRFEVTGRAADRMVFKIPSLRNVAKTGPWFHDGSVERLPEAVRLMGRHQLGVELSEEEVSSIVSFLDALTGPAPTR